MCVPGNARGVDLGPDQRDFLSDTKMNTLGAQRENDESVGSGSSAGGLEEGQGLPVARSLFPAAPELDAMLTIEQFARWRQIPVRSAEAMVRDGTVGVVRDRRPVRIHVRTYLSGLGAQFRKALP